MELGHLLFNKFFSASKTVDEQTFTSALSNLKSLTWHRGDFHEAESFYFSVFSRGQDTIDRGGMESMTCYVNDLKMRKRDGEGRGKKGRRDKEERRDNFRT